MTTIHFAVACSVCGPGVRRYSGDLYSNSSHKYSVLCPWPHAHMVKIDIFTDAVLTVTPNPRAALSMSWTPTPYNGTICLREIPFNTPNAPFLLYPGGKNLSQGSEHEMKENVSFAAIQPERVWRIHI